MSATFDDLALTPARERGPGATTPDRRRRPRFGMRRRYARAISLRLIMVAVLVTTALVPLGIFWAWSQAVAFQNQIDDVADRHLLLARNLTAALSRYQRDIRATFTLLSANVASGVEIPGMDAMMANLGIRCVCRVAPDGSVRETIEAPGISCPDAIRPARLAVLSHASVEGAATFSHVMADAAGRPTLYLLKRDGGDLIIGALSTDHFIELARSISFGANGHAAIVDNTGRVLAHPKAEWQQEMRDISAVPAVQRMLNGQTGIGQFYSPALEDDMIAGFSAVPETGWGVMIPQPVNELRDAAAAANRSALLILGSSLVIAVALGWLLAMRLIAPLRAVIAAARRMAGGEVGARIPTQNRALPISEFREIRYAFNGMASAVQRANDKQRQARRAADDANQAKSMFLANTSHELRTPLNAIIGFSEAMDQEIFGPIGEPHYRAYVGDIRQSAGHLLRLINDLLDISSFDLGKLKLAEAEVRLSVIIDAVAIMTRRAAEEMDVALTFGTAGDPTARNCVLWVDADRLSQILINLVDNALRHTRPGGRVTVNGQRTADGGMMIQVADSGSGIAADKLANVMEPFQRGEKASTRKDEGVGLGLAIVGAIARSHQAEFTLQSVPGEGTTATLILPPERVVKATQQ